MYVYLLEISTNETKAIMVCASLQTAKDEASRFVQNCEFVPMEPGKGFDDATMHITLDGLDIGYIWTMPVQGFVSL